MQHFEISCSTGSKATFFWCGDYNGSSNPSPKKCMFGGGEGGCCRVIHAPLVDLCMAVAIPEGSLRVCGALNWMSVHWALLNPRDVLCSFIETILKVFHC